MTTYKQRLDMTLSPRRLPNKYYINEPQETDVHTEALSIQLATFNVTIMHNQR